MRTMASLTDDTNIVLIGMPGAGKSTVGVLLAKALSRSFIDTDVHIQAREGARLQHIIDTRGLDVFRGVEEKHILSLNCRGHVIATGGSVVYSARAMAHLRAHGVTVHMALPLAELERRVTNLDSRGVVIGPGQSFADLYEERQPLYVRYADVSVDCAGITHEQTVARIVASLPSTTQSA